MGILLEVAHIMVDVVDLMDPHPALDPPADRVFFVGGEIMARRGPHVEGGASFREIGRLSPIIEIARVSHNLTR